jgi:hypothetical protein
MIFNKSENNEGKFGMVLSPGIDRERECGEVFLWLCSFFSFCESTFLNFRFILCFSLHRCFCFHLYALISVLIPFTHSVFSINIIQQHNVN